MKLSEDSRRSRAEVLFCIDYLCHHINDEPHQDTWLSLGIPDGEYSGNLTDDQVKPYLDYVEDDVEDADGERFDYNYFLKLGVDLIYRECFKIRYEKDGIV